VVRAARHPRRPRTPVHDLGIHAGRGIAADAVRLSADALAPGVRMAVVRTIPRWNLDHRDEYHSGGRTVARLAGTPAPPGADSTADGLASLVNHSKNSPAQPPA